MKIINRVVFSVICLILAGLAFIFFVPGYNLYLVRSESMKPAINMGDLIVTAPLNSPLSAAVETGTVITFDNNGKLITHRVWSTDGSEISTKGDAVEDPDPWTIMLSNIRGVYLFKIPYVGYFTSFVQTKTGWFVTIIIPAALLVLWLAKDIVKEAFSEA